MSIKNLRVAVTGAWNVILKSVMWLYAKYNGDENGECTVRARSP